MLIAKKIPVLLFFRNNRLEVEAYFSNQYLCSTNQWQRSWVCFLFKSTFVQSLLHKLLTFAGREVLSPSQWRTSSCTKPQIITSWIYINWKRQKAASFLPFFLYFCFFFPLGEVSSLRFVENRCDSTLMHSDFIAYWNICITLNLENKLKLLMDFE